LKPLGTKLFSVIIICYLGFLVYSNSLLSPFHFDDIGTIVDNSAIKHLFNLANIWNFFPARFITFFSFALNYQIHQLNVVGYHIVNLAVHLGSAILLFWLVNLTLLTPVMREEKISQQAKLISLFTALVFLTHPIQTQGVNYITQRSALLATLFCLASLGLYAKSRLLLAQGSTQSLARRYYFSSLAVAIIAMFTKEMAITLPLAICLYEFSFFKTSKSFNFKQLIPFLTTLIIIPLTMLVTKSVAFTAMWQESEGVLNIPPWHYLLTKLIVLASYIRLAFLPLNQNLDYDFPIFTHLLSVPVLFSLLFLILSIVIAFRLFRSYRLISFGILFFFLTLLFEWSIIPIPEVIYEHRLYLPMVGFSIFLVTSLYYLIPNKHPKAMLTILVILVAVYSALTYARNNVWKDDLTLWNDTVNKSPHKSRPYHNRGLAYQNQGKFNQAISDYNKAIEMNPGYADSYNNRGLVYQNKGDLDQAIANYNKAIAINPNCAHAYSNRGLVYKIKGDLNQALSDFNKAIEIGTGYSFAYYNRGLAYQNKGDFNQAIADYNKTIEINPGHAYAYYNRGLAYQNKGDFNQALSDYNKAIAINSGYISAYNNRGNVYQNQGKFNQAILDYNKAIEINSSYAETYNNRGLAYQNKGELNQAISDYNKAIEINPNYAIAYNNRAVVYFLNKRYDQSWDDLHKAETLGYKINPGFIEALKKASGREK
jgi:protein O-mannosyl-transferase